MRCVALGGTGIALALNKIVAASEKDWKASAWLLERTPEYRPNYEVDSKVKHSGGVDMQVNLQFVKPKPEEELPALLSVFDDPEDG